MTVSLCLKSAAGLFVATCLVLGATTATYAHAAPPEALVETAKKELPTETLYKLWEEAQSNPNAAETYYKSLQQKHVFEPIKGDDARVLVTYFALGSDKTDYILQAGGPDFYGLRFKQLGNTNLYYCTQRVPRDAMFIYGFNEFTSEPQGKNAAITKTGMNHIYDGAFYGPDAPLSPYVEARAGTEAGSMKTVTLKSKHMQEDRSITIYTPAGYDKNVPHNLIIQFDGRQYAAGPNAGPAHNGWTPMATILDNMQADGTITPAIAVMIPNQGNRSRDLISDEMADFIGLELLPWVKANYTISTDAADTIISGPSRGGFAAANVALKYSGQIGGVLSQSGSFWLTEQGDKNWPVYPEYDGKLIGAYKASPTLPIKFYLSTGLYDLGAGIVGTNRQMRDILELKGYTVIHKEYKAGHSHASWRHTLSDGIEVLLAE